jgi:hypothetical protein
MQEKRLAEEWLLKNSELLEEQRFSMLEARSTSTQSSRLKLRKLLGRRNIADG